MAKGKYSKWITEEGLTLLTGWARDGLTDDQIAHNVGISRQTLYDWKKRYPDISDALKKGKEVIDLQVENALLKRALGYEYTEVTKERLKNRKTGKEELVETKVVIKQQAPDTTAQIFWLKNRKPKEWRDKQDVEHSGIVTNQNVDMSGLSEEELKRLANLNGGTEEPHSRTGKTRAGEA